MEQLDNQPDKINTNEPGTAQASLKDITQELEQLKQRLVLQLSQEIEQLQSRKNNLLSEVNQLELTRQQQITQQQEFVNQIAPVLANQIQNLLKQHLDKQNLINSSSANSTSGLSEYNENTYRLISSLDSTLRSTLNTLQQDLSSYQNFLSQQLSQMYTLEQQGENVLEDLVNKLKAELQSEVVIPSPSQTQTTVEASSPLRQIPSSPPPTTSDPLQNLVDEQIYSPEQTSTPPSPPPTNVKPEVKTQRVAKTSKTQLGFLLIFLYSLALSLYNVVMSMISNPSKIFGLGSIGGIISNSVGNSLLILFLRMCIVVPLMGIIANFLYPKTWKDIRKLTIAQDSKLWLKAIGSGFFLFLSQVLIYIAFGSSLTPGVVITIFFIFPIVTVLLSWLFFGERPSLIRNIATAIVFLGIILISRPTATNFSVEGITTAVGSGITFAFYVLLTQACVPKIHPIPFSFINFCSILIFSILSLFVFSVMPIPEGWVVNVNPDIFPQLFVFVLILGGLTLLSYLFNNIGISLIGAARASIFGATGPVLTSLLAWLIIGRTLEGQQVWGMLTVTAGVAALSLERLFLKSKLLKTSKK